MMNRLHKIAVIGAGSWGTALSMVLATRECEVVLWTPEEAQARQLAETRRSPVLSETAAPLAPNIHPTCDLDQVKDAELIVVVAYGCILPKSVLEAPKYGCINLHVSLLPKYRGSAPVQWAVLNGDTETGVSIMQMDEGLDTGDVLVCEKIAIGPEETSGELFDRVTAVGARVLCEAVPAMEAGTLRPQPQQHENATLAPMLDKELAEFRLTDTAAHIHNWVRGMNPWPMAWFVTAGGKKVKVTECRVAASNGEAPGTVLSTKPLTVACADGAVQLLHVVPEGKKPMDGTSFAAGLRLKAGDTL